MSALLIHVTGGHIETHFHVFGSLAFLAFYLDWPVLITASIVTIIDHLVQGIYLPLSMFGTPSISYGRLAEHAGWVVFCVAFLVYSCLKNRNRMEAIASREAEQKALLFQAYHDPLTELPNRLHLQKTLRELLQMVAPPPFAVLAIDLDRFKEVNDTLGHHVGDEVLIEVAARLTGQLRRTDTLVRMGGDEFLMVVPECESSPWAESVAQRLLDVLKKPIQCAEHTVTLSGSVGISMYPQSGVSEAELLKHADLALYMVKNRGRNGFQLFDETMREETLLQMRLEHRLQRALANEEFEVHYQPLVTVSGRLLGFEALLRWNDPEFGRIQPNDFIGLAETTGLIVPIGEWVLRQACNQAASWIACGHDLKKMSVNVSIVQLRNKDFVSTVIAALRESRLQPKFLDLELTENVMVEDFVHTREQLAVLRRLGVRLSIDDFGQGYSSLAYLRELPVHTIKLDRTFIRGIEDSNEARSLVASIISMAHTLDLQVVAEGVENFRQLELLTEDRCDEIQGYYISKPLPLAELGGILKQSHRDVVQKRVATSTVRYA